MASNKIQFRSIHELQDPTLNSKLAQHEFANEIPVDEFLAEEKVSKNTTSRRDFLKLMGFSTAAVTLAACEAPVVKTIPYVVKPHNIIPGVPNYYASAFYDGFDFSCVLVKTREGRPISVAPNASAKDLGGTKARAQASVLSLYDNEKVKQPKLKGVDATFSALDDYVLGELAKTQQEGKKIVVLSHSLPSPTFKKLFGEFKEKYPTAELVIYDALPYSANLDAAEEVFGQRALPIYDLSSTELVVSFQADFLGDFNAQNLESSYAVAKKPGKSMLRHIQVESNMSLTGANADTRIPLTPSAVAKTLVEVYKGLNGGTSDKTAQGIVKELQAKGSKALVLADGSKAAIVLSHLINQKLGSVAFTKQANYLKEFNGARYSEFLSWLNQGQIGTLIINNVNPIYSSNKGADFQKALKKVRSVVSIVDKKNEIYDASHAVIPAANWLESWGDIAPRTGFYAFTQPTIQKVFKPRQLEESLLVWINGKNSPANNYYNYLKANAVNLLEGSSFNQALYKGFNTSSKIGSLLNYVGGNAEQAIAEINSIQPSKAFELTLYTKTGIGDGTQSNNPWLMELPDPITRLSWDNYLTISPKDADKLNIQNKLNARMQLNGDTVNLKVNGVEIKDLPVFIQPGQAQGSLGLALGYGKKNSGKTAATGINVYPLFDGKNLSLQNVTIEKTGSEHEFAGMQLQNTLMGRYDIAKEVSLEEFINVPFDDSQKGWNKPIEYHTINGSLPARKIDLWDTFDDTDGPHFNLSIDLNACTGCGACVIACQAENNVPVVGKEEIRMSRDMYWLRIDRYYSAKENISTKEQVDRKLNVPEVYDILIEPAENPDVIFQPVMCQHCNHAPCENVCPVAATSHGKQGQNQMAYNRCIGTRYCANNCPYKVRRFNWFNYSLNDKFDFHMNNDLGRMVLNPDVVTRTRGVMEKCSLCIQETQATILAAKKEGRKVTDEEFQNSCACAVVCSTGAMKFGDMNDKTSEVRKLYASNRRYHLLEEIGAKPNVFYHTKVRNRVEK